MKEPIAIAIPVYNREKKVMATLDSVAAQTFRPLRLILVDNNSSDNTHAALRKWKAEHESPDFRIDVIQELKPGACAARNAALRIIDSPWTMFFDSDDTMPPDHVEVALAAASENPDTDIIAWARLLHLPGGRKVVRGFTLKSPKFSNLTQTIFATPNYMARTELFRRVGGWDETVAVGQDLELGSRLLCVNPKIFVRKGHFVDIYDSATSITNSTPDRMSALKHTLDKVRLTFPENKRHLVDLQFLARAATWGKSDPKAHDLAKETLEAQPWHRRWLFGLLYRYALRGGRGVAKIYALLHLNKMP